MATDNTELIELIPGKHPKSERQMLLAVLHMTGELTVMPITKEKIDNARKRIEGIEKLYDKCVDEISLGEWAV